MTKHWLVLLSFAPLALAACSISAALPADVEIETATAATETTVDQTAKVTNIVLDGSFADWTHIASAIDDPADAPEGAPIDLGSIRVTHDASYVYLAIELGRTINVQQLRGNLLLVFNSDGKDDTGGELFGLSGADFAVVFSPKRPDRPEQPGMGVGLLVPIKPKEGGEPGSRIVNPYAAGMIFAPTYASSKIEMRLERGAVIGESQPIFMGRSFTMRAIVTDLSGDVVDDTEVYEHALSFLANVVPTQPNDPLSRDEGVIRVVSWNAEFGGIVTKSNVFGRILRAIQPDIVLLQELGDKNSAEEMKAFFNSQLPLEDEQSTWHVAFGAGGGNLRCGIASRFEMHEVESLSVLNYETQPRRTLRFIGTVVRAPGGHLLVNSVHMKCCGGINTREDTTRIEEAKVINRAVRQVLVEETIKGVVLGGDLNLVGSITPMEILYEAADRDGTDLAVAGPLQLDGRSNTTWSQRNQPFVPGRLDFILYSDSTLTKVNSFVFESSDLMETWRKHHGIEAGDSELATDHFPVVVDLRWK